MGIQTYEHFAQLYTIVLNYMKEHNGRGEDIIMATKADEHYTQLYTIVLNYMKEHNGQGYSPMLFDDVRPIKKRTAMQEGLEEENDDVYFYSETEAEILKRQIITKPDGRILLITAIKPKNIEIISDELMVKLIVQKIMGNDSFAKDEKGISR